jgi:hypothetical protein
MRGLLLILLAKVASAGADLDARSPWSVDAAYYGETFTHPGVSLGVERKLLFWGRRFGIVEHGLFTGADVGTWWHARYAVGAFADATLGYRIVFAGGFRLELLGGAGYLQTFDAGTVYVVDAQGNVSRAADPGHPALLLTGSLGLGWDLSVPGIAPLSVFLRAGAFGQYPYNGEVLPHLGGQLGVSIPLGAS